MHIKPPCEVDLSEPALMRINLNQLRCRSKFSHLRQLSRTQYALMRICFVSVEGPYKATRNCNVVGGNYPFRGTDVCPWAWHTGQCRSGRLSREVDWSELVPMHINLNQFRCRSEFSHLRQLARTQYTLMCVCFVSVEGPYKATRICNVVGGNYPFRSTDVCPWAWHTGQCRSGCPSGRPSCWGRSLLWLTTKL